MKSPRSPSRAGIVVCRWLGMMGHGSGELAAEAVLPSAVLVSVQVVAGEVAFLVFTYKNFPSRQYSGGSKFSSRPRRDWSAGAQVLMNFTKVHK
jgi:hypothetical protein